MEVVPRVARKSKNIISAQIEVYKEYKGELLENGFVKPATRAIYTVLSGKLNMTAKAINLSIVRNSELIFGEKYSNKKFEEKISAVDEKSEDFWSSDSWVTIKLNDAEQQMFQFAEKKYSGRNRQILEKDWANNLSAIIIRETKTECCINFVRAEVISNELESNGYCAECLGTINVKSFDNRRILKVKITEGSEKHTFTRKRRLTHDRKRFFEEKLKTTYPSNVLNGLANEMPLMEHESRDIPSESALKSIRHKVLNNSMLDQNCINALRKMKYLPQFEGAIKEISTDPLRVIFWTRYQEMWYKNYAENEIPNISVDATGSIVTSANLLSALGLDHIKLPHIFLYLIVAKTSEGVSVPVGQFLSADQRSIAISYFFQSWQLAFKKLPRVIVLDDSAALLKSCVISFTSCQSSKDYVHNCCMAINGNKDALPACYIRMDISHFVKNLRRLDVFKKIDKRIADFYLCCIGVIIQCESFEDIKNIVRNVLLLATNPNEGSLRNGQLLPSAESRNKLNKLIRTHNVAFVSDSDDKLKDSTFEEFESAADWIDEIIAETSLEEKKNYLDESNIEINMYYLPDLVGVLRKLCSRMTADTLASSSNVESTFNRIKNIIMQNIRLPVRIDLFMEKYLASINGSTKLAISKYPHKEKSAAEEIEVRRLLWTDFDNFGGN